MCYLEKIYNYYLCTENIQNVTQHSMLVLKRWSLMCNLLKGGLPYD